jgi:hypothetical protein
MPCDLWYNGTCKFFHLQSAVTSYFEVHTGIGVAGMLSLAMLIAADVYKGRESLHAMSRVSMAIAIGSVSAPLIGGGLASLGWNYPFLFYVLSLPFAFIHVWNIGAFEFTFYGFSAGSEV